MCRSGLCGVGMTAAGRADLPEAGDALGASFVPHRAASARAAGVNRLPHRRRTGVQLFASVFGASVAAAAGVAGYCVGAPSTSIEATGHGPSTRNETSCDHVRWSPPVSDHVPPSLNFTAAYV